ncbi:MAG: hypothetical protein ACQKBU_00105, partial [Verrucomicrobiales bacterium]
MHRLLLLPLFLSGCMPPSSLDENLALTGPLQYQQTSGRKAGLASPWWKTLNDSSLNRKIDQALAENLAQQQLAKRIERASANLRREGGALFPQIDLTGDTEYDSLDPGSEAR